MIYSELGRKRRGRTAKVNNFRGGVKAPQFAINIRNAERFLGGKSMNSPTNHNPYQPPKADVTPPPEPKGEYMDGGRAALAGNGVQWIGSGWTLFTRAPALWIGITFVLFLMSIVLAVIPVIGGLASNILMPIFIGGIMLGFRSLDEGGALQFEHLFAGFKEKGGQLALVGLLLMAATTALVFIVVIIALIVVGGSLLQSGGDTSALMELFSEQGLMLLLLFVLIIMALALPLAMAYWFAPALVVFHNMDAFTAMKQSFVGCLRNIMPFLVYGIVLLPLAVVAILPVFLGLLVFTPVVYGSLYASYKDIYLKS
jgi:hypothetical protein